MRTVDVSHRAASTAYNNLAGDVVTVTVDDDEVAPVTVCGRRGRC